MTKEYRQGVGIVLINKDKKIWIGQRLKEKSAIIDGKDMRWQMPQGGIDSGEDPRQAAIRELEEETGVTSCLVKVVDESDWISYDFPKNITNKMFSGKYAGQRQKWFLMEFNGDDKNINVDQSHQEFDMWRWADKSEVVKLIIDFKKSLYQNVLQSFRHYLS